MPSPEIAPIEASLSAGAQSILYWWSRATAADLAHGRRWYSDAEDIARALAAGSRFTVDQCAGVVAALSPRNPWPTNVEGATALVDAASKRQAQPRVVGFERNRDKAWSILHYSGDPLDILGGPKVRAFYRAILGDLNSVTVDVWAGRAAGSDKEGSFTQRQYDAIVADYQAAARVLGITPRDLQAAVWVAIRRITLENSVRHQWILDREV